MAIARRPDRTRAPNRFSPYAREPSKTDTDRRNVEKLIDCFGLTLDDRLRDLLGSDTFATLSECWKLFGEVSWDPDKRKDYSPDLDTSIRVELAVYHLWCAVEKWNADNKDRDENIDEDIDAEILDALERLEEAWKKKAKRFQHAEDVCRAKKKAGFWEHARKERELTRGLSMCTFTS